MTAEAALPSWCRAIRADNPGPMTLDGTNTYVVSTSAGAVVIDPGPLDENHLTTVADTANEACGAVLLTVLTHHHADHTGGAERFHYLTGAPVLARDPALCRGGALPRDGEVLDVPGPALRVVDTPGHTADSICLASADDMALFSGDTVLGRGTTVVAHPDGNLGAYLASLERLRGVTGENCVLLPGHGPRRNGARAVLDDYLAHRYQRLDQVRAAVTAGARTARDVVEIVYADVDRSLWPAAELTVQAALDHLRAQP